MQLAGPRALEPFDSIQSIGPRAFELIDSIQSLETSRPRGLDRLCWNQGEPLGQSKTESIRVSIGSHGDYEILVMFWQRAATRLINPQASTPLVAKRENQLDSKDNSPRERTPPIRRTGNRAGSRHAAGRIIREVSR
jgi:hypothetical protein